MVTVSRFEQVAPELRKAVEAGATLEEACRTNGVNVNTARTWLHNGRTRPDGRHGAFAAAIDATKRSRPRSKALRRSPALSREEWERRLAEAVRSGSVPAMKLWFDTHPADPETPKDDPFAEFDDLAERKSRA